MASKERVHNEWFMRLSKTTCPCGEKNTECFAWGEYHYAKWRTITHFCKACFQKEVMDRLVSHAQACGCMITIQARSGHSLPDWLKMMTPIRCVVNHKVA